jgi:UDP-GlcNAc:undecaprenyl-phosphate/decaprenyl-phosphate GlcNAc-1-phosphate transferase
MPLSLIVPVCALVAFVGSLAACRVMMTLGPRDAPDGIRKLQASAVPTSGGLGFSLALAASGALAIGLGWPTPGTPVLATLVGAAAALAIGLWDDRVDAPARTKLILLLAASLAMVAAGVRADQLEPWPGMETILPLSVAAAGAMVWLIVVINAVNFMDGANGLAMGMAAIASAGFGGAGLAVGETGVALTGLLGAAALVGFLVWNCAGRLYAGDAGALFMGALLGGLSLALVKARPDLLFVPPLLLLPFLTDVLLTLAWRAHHRKPLFRAHRDHVYQIAIRAGLRHWQVSAIHAVWAANAAAVAIVAAIAGGRVPALAFLAFLAASCWVHWRARRSGVRAGLVGARAD